jgi:monoamine oxidase
MGARLGTTATHHCDVLVVGAGLAGLVAADRLVRAGQDVRVLEAGDRVGGRVRGEWSGGRALETGAEFVGRPHERVRALIDTLGLRTQPTRLGRAPTLWRLPDRRQVSRLPPLPGGELRRLARGWWRLRRRALAMPSRQPWTAPRVVADLDTVSLAEWLSSHGVTQAGLDVTDALLAGFATRPITELSAAHAAWWISAAGGLRTALRSGHEHTVVGGTHQIPRLLARSLGDRVHLSSPVSTIAAQHHQVEVHTEQQVWKARAVVVAVPLNALRNLKIAPPPPPARAAAVRELSYGSAVKISAVTSVVPPVPHRTVAGGSSLAIAWQHGQVLAGIATHPGLDERDLVDDLAAAFSLTPQHLTAVAVTDWTHEAHIGGSYLLYQPGQLIAHAAALHTHGTRIRYAGADVSGWPNSMEGAVQSGQDAADALLAAPVTTLG